MHLGPNYLYDVDARVYNKAGQAQTGEITVAQTTGDTRPSVAMDANGDFVVSWQVFNTSTYLYGISAHRYNLAGTAQGSTIVLNSGASHGDQGTLPKVAMDSAGDFTIAFQGYDANSHGIFAQRFNASGVSQGAIFPVNTVTTGNQRRPDDRDGFRRRCRDRLAGRRRGSSRGDLCPALQLVGRGPRRQYRYQHGHQRQLLRATPRSPWSRPASTPLPGNSIRLLPAPVNGFQGVETQRFDATGVALTGVVQLNTPENYNQGNPAVAIDSERRLRRGVGELRPGRRPRRRSTPSWPSGSTRTGTLIGTTQFTPSTQTGDNQRFPSVAYDPNGDTMIVWESKPSATSSAQDVYGRLYNHVNNAPTINTPSNVSINENAGQQTVNLTGIAAGGGETQNLTVSASSNNTALINPIDHVHQPEFDGDPDFHSGGEQLRNGHHHRDGEGRWRHSERRRQTQLKCSSPSPSTKSALPSARFR